MSKKATETCYVIYTDCGCHWNAPPIVALTKEDAIFWEKTIVDLYNQKNPEMGWVFAWDSKEREKEFPNCSFDDWVDYPTDLVYVDSVEVKFHHYEDATSKEIKVLSKWWENWKEN